MGGREGKTDQAEPRMHERLHPHHRQGHYEEKRRVPDFRSRQGRPDVADVDRLHPCGDQFEIKILDWSTTFKSLNRSYKSLIPDASMLLVSRLNFKRIKCYLSHCFRQHFKKAD